MATALYRRYRPETFAEVIGQEHVTDPLRAALRAGRANHAYLFSGPRGCGKTTSARILARCLNCAQGPTDVPCGVCDSCVELARGGSGSLDVVEIDAASHGGVDDARELRERAAFAPARDRFKIYIIDEAHMVTPQGFNALLKIVEEPPEHVMFVFATTEPDKVLGTIRSRTHHYPFHLVPPQVLTAHLQAVCDEEGVAVGPGVLPLVVRAGAGSVRDSLSVLDQLAAGAGPDGIDYERAVGLLGYTHASLLDDVVAAFAASDGATVFRAVDRVISSGQDPRRFVDDLLQRLRDLLIVQAVGERSHEVFPGVAQDQLERMAVQAASFGAAQLSRSADLANAANTEMTGATSPRLHLELLCARMLLPAADDGEVGLGARLDRLERRLSVPLPAGAPAAVPTTAPGAVAPAATAGAPTAPAPADAAREADRPEAVEGPTAGDRPVEAAPGPAAAGARPGPGADGGWGGAARSGSAEPARDEQAPRAPSGPTRPSAPAAGGAPSAPAAGPGAEAAESVRRLWPQVLDHLAAARRRTWTRVSQDCQVLRVDDRQVVLQFRKAGTLAAFAAGPHADAVREALVAVLGLDRQVVAVAEGGAGSDPFPSPAPASVSPPVSPARAAQAPPPSAPSSVAPAPAPPASAAPAPGWGEPAAPRTPLPAAGAPGADARAADAATRAVPTRDAAERPRSSGGAPGAPPWEHAPQAGPDARGTGRPAPAGPAAAWGPGDLPPEPPDDDPYPPDDPYSSDDPSAESGPPLDPAPPRPADAPAPPVGRSERAAVPSPVTTPSRGAPPSPGAPVGRADPRDAPAAPPTAPPPAALRGADLVRSAVRSAGSGAAAGAAAGASAPDDDQPSYDDADAEGSGLVGTAVAEQLLGARVLSIDPRR